VRSIPSERRIRPIRAAFLPGRHVPVGAGMPTVGPHRRAADSDFAEWAKDETKQAQE
jgi:hypothetical protein